MTCPADGVSANASPDFGDAVKNGEEVLEPLTSEEIAILNQRLQSRVLKLYQSPPVYDKFRFYELPHNQILLVMHDYSDAKVDLDKGFIYDRNSGQWQEHDTTYYAPDNYHPKLGVGWQVGNHFLLSRGHWEKKLWGKIEGGQLVNPQEVDLVDFETPKHQSMLKHFLESPAAGGVKTYLPNPCNKLIIS